MNVCIAYVYNLALIFHMQVTANVFIHHPLWSYEICVIDSPFTEKEVRLLHDN